MNARRAISDACRLSARGEWLLALLLALAAWIVFMPALHYQFVCLDDPEYLTANTAMQNGLAWSGIRWVFTSVHVGNWHPLTGLSLLLDNQFYGMRPGGYHRTSLLLHVFNVVLLFRLLCRASGACWRSALAAALFAVHPLHVESVVWISARKDMLSMFFGLLTLHAYVAYAAQPCARCRRAWTYGLALGAYLLGLMAKPMLVSLPFLMLFLDYWPLRRLQAEQVFAGAARRRALALFGEKIPFIVLAVLFCLITFYVQRQSGAVKSLDHFPFAVRLANAVWSYGRYLRRFVLPLDLCCYYPYPPDVMGEPIGLTGGILVLLTLAAAWLRKARPYLIVGWLWYLTALLPVIGLVQVGRQAMADRYAYLPLIGIYVATAWGLGGMAQLIERKTQRQYVLLLAGLALAALVTLALVARRQVLTWRNSNVLFEHALCVTGGSDLIHNNYGNILHEQGCSAEAEAQFRAAVRLNPDYLKAHYNLGVLLMGRQVFSEAAPCFERVLALDPGFAGAYFRLGDLCARTGRLDESVLYYRRALAIEPFNAEIRNNYGVLLMDLGRFVEALPQFLVALSLQDTSPTRYNIVLCHIHAGQYEAAIRHYHNALAAHPKDVFLLHALLARLAAQQDLDASVRTALGSLLRDALALDPGRIWLRQALDNLSGLQEDPQGHYAQ